jgi:hypothetical protein
MARPTFEDLRAEADKVIGPHEPPKMQRTTAWGDEYRRRLAEKKKSKTNVSEPEKR